MIGRCIWVVVALSLTFVVPACDGDDVGDGDDTAVATPTGTTATDEGEGTTVDVTLQEFAIGTVPSGTAAGEVTFSATNEGPDDPHELVVIATDLAIDALPTGDDGAVDEEGEGIEVIGEIEEFPVGETEEAAWELEPGAYVLICNIVEDEDGETESHYQEGMRTAFTVT